MSLENLNLVELNAQEVQEVEGGWFGWLSNWGMPGVDFLNDGSEYGSRNKWSASC